MCDSATCSVSWNVLILMWIYGDLSPTQSYLKITDREYQSRVFCVCVFYFCVTEKKGRSKFIYIVLTWKAQRTQQHVGQILNRVSCHSLHHFGPYHRNLHAFEMYTYNHPNGHDVTLFLEQYCFESPRKSRPMNEMLVHFCIITFFLNKPICSCLLCLLTVLLNYDLLGAVAHFMKINFQISVNFRWI